MERAPAARTGAAHVVGVGSGTGALVLRPRASAGRRAALSGVDGAAVPLGRAGPVALTPVPRGRSGLVPGMSCLRLEDLVQDLWPEVVVCVVLGTPGSPPTPVLVTSGPRDPVARRNAVTGPRLSARDDVPRAAPGKVRRIDLLTRLVGTAGTYGTGRWP